MNREAMAAAEWVVKVLNEAEPLSTACQLALRQEAYEMLVAGMLKRQVLTKLCNDIFFTTEMAEGDAATELRMRKDAGLYISGET